MRRGLVRDDTSRENEDSGGNKSSCNSAVSEQGSDASQYRNASSLGGLPNEIFEHSEEEGDSSQAHFFSLEPISFSDALIGRVSTVQQEPEDDMMNNSQVLAGNNQDSFIEQSFCQHDHTVIQDAHRGFGYEVQN